MTIDRFPFQRKAVAELTDPGDVILNVGANYDPGMIKASFPDRQVLNCDFVDTDIGMGFKIEADHFFDCSEKPWPFETDSARLVIFGDILEHLTRDGIVTALQEARRVADYVCITVPRDPRFMDSPLDPADGNPWQHITLVDQHLLSAALRRTKWEPLEWETVHYIICDEGYFVTAKRG
jgi:hypothetical protein